MLRIVIFLVSISVALAAYNMEPFDGLWADFGSKMNREIKNDKAIIVDVFIKQKLDHFNPLDNRTFDMVYTYKDDYFVPNGPIFLAVPSLFSELHSSQMHDIGKEVGALLVVIQSRFTWSSIPFPNLDVESIRYVNTEQELEDIANVVSDLKREERFSRSKVIVFGCWLKGITATWARIKYPHLIHGAVSSSAPAEMKANFHEYYDEMEALIIEQVGVNCRNIIHDGFKEAMDVVAENNTQRFMEGFRMCGPQSFNFEDVTTFMLSISQVFSVIYASDGCEFMNNVTGTALDKIGELLKSRDENGCVRPLTIGNIINIVGPDAVEANRELRLNLYKICTEFGFFRTSESSESLFAGSIPTAYFTDHFCPRAFHENISGDRVLAAIDNTNLRYGGKKPDVTRLISVHGQKDVYRHAGITEDLNPESPAIVIDNAGLCEDYFDSFNNPDVMEAKRRISEIVKSWLD